MEEVIVAINKIDNQKRMNDIYSFYELGFDNIIAISGEHNIGIADLLDEITKDFHPQEEINLIDIGGVRRVYGLRNLVDGFLDGRGVKEWVLK